MLHFKSKLVKTRYSIHFTCSIFCLFDLACLFHSTLYFLVSGSTSSLHLGNSSMTSASMTKSLQDNLTIAVVVESSSTPLTTFYIISASPRGSGASPMFTEQPSSNHVLPSSPAVSSSMKLPESSPEPNSTQIYNLNGTPTISHLELHV